MEKLLIPANPYKPPGELRIIRNLRKMMLFTDGSVNPQTGIGYGAFVAVDKIDESLSDVAKRIRTRRFDSTSSTRLELETLLWALSEMRPTQVDAYTDSQNIQGLLKRRARIEKNNYCSKSGRPYKHGHLYKEFFKWADRINFRVIKVSGHSPGIMKSKTDKIFSLVDKASRDALKAFYSSNNLSLKR
ncbi:MAG: ribonuclease H [Desulfobacteraceae bacterium]|nr:ribonuclease H [Desulfobacteraceae bacterium]